MKKTRGAASGSGFLRVFAGAISSRSSEFITWQCAFASMHAVSSAMYGGEPLAGSWKRRMRSGVLRVRLTAWNSASRCASPMARAGSRLMEYGGTSLSGLRESHSLKRAACFQPVGL